MHVLIDASAQRQLLYAVADQIAPGCTGLQIRSRLLYAVADRWAALACEGEVALAIQLALVAGVEPAACGRKEWHTQSGMHAGKKSELQWS